MTEFEPFRQRVNQALAALLPDATVSQDRLIQAMHYSLCNGGKRLRPTLVYASAELFEAPPSIADMAACAVECIHAYSLIHDDLPAMDDDDLRRGQPTCHIAFDEATAILAGDALQSLAYECLCAAKDSSPEARLQMVQTLSLAAGAQGMVAGQAVDLAATNTQLDIHELQRMHRLKTGALIAASVSLGAIASERASTSDLAKLDNFSRAIGLAFQVQDDILDVTADTATLGKRQGADQLLNKPTYVSLLGLDQARLKAAELLQESHDALSPFGTRGIKLKKIADYLVNRDY